MSVTVGDCVEVMASMDANSVDAIVTDPLPPYGLEFMGKEWDRLDVRQPDGETFHRSGVGLFDRAKVRHASAPSYGGSVGAAMQAWHEAWAREAFRVLKPGGHLLAFGGTRTVHRLACAVEDAGFEIRDTIAWMYGSGFPKSLDVGKAIDRMAGAERQVVAQGENWGASTAADGKAAYGDYEGRWNVTAPATPEAEQWDGWGTALKPSHEPVVVARKPLSGTVAGNVLLHGTGALNIDGCRVEATDERAPVTGFYNRSLKARNAQANDRPWMDRVAPDESGAVQPHEAGRWPANVVLSHTEDCVQVGTRRVKDASGWSQTGSKASENRAMSGPNYARDPKPDAHTDADGMSTVPAWDCAPGCPVRLLDEQTGEASYNPGKTFGKSSGGRIYGAGAGIPAGADVFGYGDSGGASRFFYTAKSSRAERNAGLPPGERSSHPTVKPLALMRWLVRLVTPPGGLVLDPFLGSGTTGCAAALEGFRFHGVERDDEYAAIARARIRFWEEHGEDGLRIVAERDRAEAKRREVAASGQLDLLGGHAA